MSFRGILFALLLTANFLVVAGCNSEPSSGSDLPSKGPATPEPPYYGTPVEIADSNAVQVTIPVKFLYRKLDFTPGGQSNGLSSVVPYVATAGTPQALAIPFAEFHVYDSSGNRIQQGETTTNGLAIFKIPKSNGQYKVSVFSRANNAYLKVSVLEDIYTNSPYSVSKSFSIDATDISAGLKDLSSSPLYAEADENLSAKIEGGAFNIMFNILLANEYIRRNIGKNNNSTGTPSADANAWWVADKVTVYWKAGFNPYSYFGGGAELSFYSPGTSKLYILGGLNGDVKSSDTDHFDDSVILHEYAHFLEDVYGHSSSPGGSHNGNFIIDPRLAWSEGFANYFQAAVLTGADAFGAGLSESRMPTSKRFHYYVDTIGYKGGGKYRVAIAFNLAEVGANASYDAVGSHPQDTGIFREVSVARTLYKSTRSISSTYPETGSLYKGGGVSFANIWKAFSGEDTSGSNRNNPLSYSLNNRAKYPVVNAGLFNWLLSQNGVSGAEWSNILTEERQTLGTRNYAYFLSPGICNGTTFTNSTIEKSRYAGDPSLYSDQQMNNDFYLYYHNGSNSKIKLEYTTTGEAMNLDLILYKSDYVYFEDMQWKAGESSEYIARSSRNPGLSIEELDLSSVPSGFYILNVKIYMYDNLSPLNGTATYTLKKDGAQLCGNEQL
jgi:hypothetical protein